MDWTDIALTVPTARLEEAEAIAHLAVPYGIYIEDYSDLLEQAPKIAHIDLIDEALLAKPRGEGIIHLYIDPHQPPAEAASFLTAMLDRAGIPCRMGTQAVREADWANAWKSFYHPTALGKRLVVCPSWEEYEPKPDALVMTLDPGMAFGSGTHHTTQLCCGMLERYVKPGDRLLDMGCGSGILSIAALLLGASEAVGVDIDAVAARTAAENAALNDCGERFTALCGDLTRDSALCERIGGGFDLIAANIVADVIIALAPAMPGFLKPGGTVVASGIIEPRAGEVTRALEAAGFNTVQTQTLDGWVCMACTRVK